MMKKVLHGALVLGVIATAWAASSGDVGVCRADANFGCSVWENNDRLKCTDVNQGIMPWAAAPKRVSQYTVRTGDGPTSSDATSYTPGELVRIYIRTKDLKYKYRGLLMHADDATKKSVGEWVFPPENNAKFWHPPACSKAVAVHLSVEIKPALTTFLWKAPPAGTGKVTFRVLLKVGPANDGEFYFPMMNDLELTEGPAAISKVWHKGLLGETCDATCARVGGTCDVEQEVIKSPADLESKVAINVACNLPAMSGCDASDPSLSQAENLCSFLDPSCAAWRGATAPATTCAGVSEGDTVRLCPCVVADTPTEPPVSPCNGVDCGSNGTCDEATGTCVCSGGFTGDLCQHGPENCVDNIKNGGETDVDCGGPDCPACTGYKLVVDGDWTACSKTCGGGLQTREVVCKDDAGTTVDISKCVVQDTVPHDVVTEQTCNEEICATYSWISGDWSPCSAQCGGGTKDRTNTCQSSIGDTMVSDSFCAGLAVPPTNVVCNTADCPQGSFTWWAEGFGECSKECGGGTATRAEAVCRDENEATVEDSKCSGDKPQPINACNTHMCPPTGEWSWCPWEECTVKCGGNLAMVAVQSRVVFCKDPLTDRVLDPAVCDATTIPSKQIEGCNPQLCTGPYWMTTPWTICSSNMRSRSAHCHNQDGSNAADDVCDPNTKPSGLGLCRNNQCPDPEDPAIKIPDNIPPELLSAGRHSKSAPSMLLLALLASAGLFTAPLSTGSRVSGLAIGLLTILSLSCGVTAHNWIDTPSRKSGSASGTRPCVPRTASDLHATLVGNEEMVIKWSSGHFRVGYFALIPGEKYDILSASNFRDQMQKYLDDAPADARLVYDKNNDRYRRWHGTPFRATSRWRDTPDSFYNEADFFVDGLAGELDRTGDLYAAFNHEEFGNEYVLRYTDEYVSDDETACYQSAEFPDFLCVFAFKHKKHLPNDQDMMMVGIPDWATDGHYIFHYNWNGYYDCIDVNYAKTGTGTGIVPPTSYIFVKVDHCQYLSPKGYETPIMEVRNGVQACTAMMSTAANDERADAGTRLGVQVVHMKNPSSVYIDWRATDPFIPWDQGVVPGAWTALPGTVKTSLDLESTWASSTSITRMEGKCAATDYISVCDETKWVGFEKSCGYCQARVNTATHSDCESYCKAQKLACIGALEDGSGGSCDTGTQKETCATNFLVKHKDTSDMICECAPAMEDAMARGLMDTLAECAAKNCPGVAFEPSASDTNYPVQGAHSFVECDSESVSANAGWVSFVKPAGATGPAVPSATKPWWQIELAGSTAIEAVTVQTPKAGLSCNSWLFKGGACETLTLGTFEGADEGATVGVSDTPCTEAGCSGEVCGTISDAGLSVLGEFKIDCGGKTGKYVYVQLNGSNRVLYLEGVFVHGATAPGDIPANADDDTMVCYGVESRDSTTTTKEYSITNDPEDPGFYSTCYVQEKNRGITISEPAPPWKYGAKCVECSNYKKNAKEVDNLKVPRWVMVPEGEGCINCKEEEHRIM